MIAGVTGASGHVGGALVRELLNQGIPVRVLARKDRRAFAGLPVEIREGDILEPETLTDFVKGCTHVFHLAALISLEPKDNAGLVRINIKGTDHVLRACRENGVERLLYCSSIHALSPYPPDKPVDEKRALVNNKGFPMYDFTKAEAERHILKAVPHGLDGIIINPTGIIGPYDFKPSFAGQSLIAFYEQKVISLVNGGFNWVDVRDVAKGALQAALKGKKGERYILSGTWLSVKQLAMLVKQVTGCKIPKVTLPIWLAWIGIPFIRAFSRIKGEKPFYSKGSLYALQHHRYVSNGKAKKELGFSPSPIEKTIEDTFKWFRDNGYI